MSETDDWVARLAPERRDEASVAALRGLLRRGLERALATRGADAADLDDFAQEGVVKVLERLGSFRGESAFTTWAMSVAIRVAFGELRRRARRERLLEQAPAVEAVAAPGEALEREEVVAALRRGIGEWLTPKQRVLIEGKLAGATSAELAERLGATPNAIYKLYYDARLRLRQGLEAAGISAEDVRGAQGGRL